MKRCSIITLIVLFFLLSCNNNSKTKIENQDQLLKLINELKQTENCRYSISKNSQNFAIACPINDSIEQKAWRWTIKLYKKDGEFIGSTGPEDLYDDIFIPLGNDSTLLVIFPVGSSTFLNLRFYHFKQNQFELVKSIDQESNIYLFDHERNGNFITYGISSHYKTSKPNMICYCKSDGQLIWSKNFVDSFPDNLMISNFSNYIFLTLKSYDKKNYMGLIFNTKGDKLIDFEIPENKIGNFKICTSNDENENDLVIYSANFMVHLDNKATNIKTYHVADKSNIYFEECNVNFSGTVKMIGYKYETDSVGKRIIADKIKYDF